MQNHTLPQLITVSTQAIPRLEHFKQRTTFQIAECYRLIGLTKRAEPYYKRVLKTDYVNSHPEVYLYAADTYKINGKYKEAIENYELYAQKVPDDPRGQLGAESTALIQEWIDNNTSS